MVVKVGVSYSHPLLSPHRAAQMSLSQGYENKHFGVSKPVSVTAYTLFAHGTLESFELWERQKHIKWFIFFTQLMPVT